MKKPQSNFEENTRSVFESEITQNSGILDNVKGTYEFDLKDSGHYFVSVDNYHVSVSKDTKKADCILSSSEKDLENVLSGNQNLLTAYLQGRVQISGNLLLAQKLFALTRLKKGEVESIK